MNLLNTIDLVNDAQLKGYAVPAFNAENWDMVRAIVEVAEEMKSPVILQTTSGTLNYLPPEAYKCYADELNCRCHISLHLDHGDSIERCVRAIKAGYTSVMIDGSKLPIEDNIAITKEAKKYASACGISVEGEIGQIGGKEDNAVADNAYADIDSVLRFAEEAVPDFMAVAIGTSHGFYKGEPKLDFDLLKSIREKTEIPLVLHGASGLSDEAIKQSISLGITKVNFATDLRVAFTTGMREKLADADVYDPKTVLKAAAEKIKPIIKSKILVCGSKDKAEKNCV